MKKTLLPLLASVLLLASCIEKKTSSSNEVSSEQTSSSEEISSSESSSSEENENYKLLRQLESKLLSLEGHINKANTTMDRVVTQSGAISINVKDVTETKRYTHSTSKYVVETKGNTTYEGEAASGYTRQIYDNGKYFYQITKYDGESTQSSKLKFSEDSVENVYDIGPAQSQITDFENIISYEQAYIENDKADYFEWTFENLEGIEEDQYLKYSYTISAYEDIEGKKALSQKTEYENKFTIKNDLIVQLDQKCKITLVTGGLVDLANTVEAELTTTYSQGEYEEFTGTLLSTK